MGKFKTSEGRVNKGLLIILSIGTFIVGIDAFIVAGVLKEMAHDLAVTPSAIGQLITIFGITYALSAPLTASYFEKLNRKSILQIALSIFIVGNIISACSVHYWCVVIGRIIAAIGAASYTPQAVVAASAIVPENKKGIALSIVYGGMTLAVALGIPLGALAGQLVSWKVPFIAVAVLGTFSFIGLNRFLPTLDTPIKHKLSERLSALYNRSVIMILLITFLAVTSEHTVYSYISVIFSDFSVGKFNALSIILFFFGIGAVLGNLISGYGTDKFGAKAILIYSVSIQTIDLLLISFFYKQIVLSCVTAFIWGATGWMYLVPIQHILLSLSKKYGAFTVSLNSSILYFGIAAGSALGGIFIYAYSAYNLGFLGFTIGLLAIFAILFAFKKKQTGKITWIMTYNL